MKKYVVEITKSALRDMSDLYDYIANALGSTINATMPERYPILDSEYGRQSGLRRMMVDSFFVFYVIRGVRVIVTDILYSASDIGWRLEDRHSDSEEVQFI